jgi:hypothetical protein
MSLTNNRKDSHTSLNVSTPEPSGRQSDDQALQPSKDVLDYIRAYARQKPDVAALWCFGLGIVVGWKIKPW